MLAGGVPKKNVQTQQKKSDSNPEEIARLEKVEGVGKDDGEEAGRGAMAQRRVEQDQVQGGSSGGEGQGEVSDGQMGRTVETEEKQLKSPEGGAEQELGRAEGLDKDEQKSQGHPEGGALVQGVRARSQQGGGAAAPRSPLIVHFDDIGALQKYQEWLTRQSREKEGEQREQPGVEHGMSQRAWEGDHRRDAMAGAAELTNICAQFVENYEFQRSVEGVPQPPVGTQRPEGWNEKYESALMSRFEAGLVVAVEEMEMMAKRARTEYELSSRMAAAKQMEGASRLAALEEEEFLARRAQEELDVKTKIATAKRQREAIQRAQEELEAEDRRAEVAQLEHSARRAHENRDLEARASAAHASKNTEDRLPRDQEGKEASAKFWDEAADASVARRAKSEAAKLQLQMQEARGVTFSEHQGAGEAGGLLLTARATWRTRATGMSAGVVPSSTPFAGFANGGTQPKDSVGSGVASSLELWSNPVWRSLLDELRTVVTDNMDDLNHLVWTDTAAARAIERTSSSATVTKVLQEDPLLFLDWEDGKPESERSQLLTKAYEWLLENRSKRDRAAWGPSELSEGVPHYLERRLLRGEPGEATDSYVRSQNFWEMPPVGGFGQSDKEVSPPRKSTKHTTHASPPMEKKKRVVVPASPQEGVAGTRCVNCGVDDPRHPDLWNCQNARVDVVRTANEHQLLAAFDAFRRKARQLRQGEASGSEHSLGSEDSYSEEEEDDGSADESMSLISSREGSSDRGGDKISRTSRHKKKASATAEGLKVISEDLRSMAVLLRSTMETQAAQQLAITALTVGRTAPRAQEQSPSGRRGDMSASQRSVMATQERDTHGRLMTMMTDGRLGLLPTPSVSEQRMVGAGGEPSQSQRIGGTLSLASTGTRSAADLPGMDGCPEIDAVDLLTIKGLETLSKSYDEYVDLCHARQRAPKPFTTMFVKHSVEIAMKFNKLMRLEHTLAIRLCKGDERYTGDSVLTMPNAEFSALYKEICTGGIKTASQVVEALDKTKFRRNLGREAAGDGNEHDALVMRAAAAFREKLDSIPGEVLKTCPESQLKKSFVRLVLGKGEGNLADYSRCTTWVQCVDHMLDIASSNLSEAFLTRARGAGRANGEESSDEEWVTQKSKKDKRVPKGEELARRSDSDKGGSQGDSETRAEDPEEDIRKWKHEYLSLRDKVKHIDSDLSECGTYWKKVKKLRWIRDQQAHRLDEQRRGGAAGGGGGGAAMPSSQLQQWRGGRPAYGDHRGFQGQGQGNGQETRSPYRQSEHRGEAQRGRDPSPRPEWQQREHSPWKADQGPPSRAQVPPGAIECYNCHELGHMAKDCKQAQRPRGTSPRPGGGGGGYSPRQAGDRFQGGGGAGATPK